MADEMLNTKQVAQYLGIHEKQVYALIQLKRIPATRVTGKWVFPRKLIDEWIETNAKSGLEQAKQKSKRVGGAILASGSNDLILDMLQAQIRKLHPDLYLFSASTGSTDGLKALNSGYTDIAWSHLYDPETGEYNIPFIPTLLPDIRPVVINLYYRELGFVTAPGNPLNIKGFEDLGRKGIRLVNRQKGAGTRKIIDYSLAKLNLDPAKITGYDNETYTHIEVGLSIQSKESDVGVASIAIADLLGLHFIPITLERFDMIVDQRTFFDHGVQAVIEIVRSEDFRNRVAKLGNYDFKDSGKILYSP